MCHMRGEDLEEVEAGRRAWEARVVVARRARQRELQPPQRASELKGFGKCNG